MCSLIRLFKFSSTATCLCFPLLSGSKLAPSLPCFLRRISSSLGPNPYTEQKAVWHTFISTPFSFLMKYSYVKQLSSAGGLPTRFPFALIVGFAFLAWPRVFFFFFLFVLGFHSGKYSVPHNTYSQIHLSLYSGGKEKTAASTSFCSSQFH